MTRVYLDTTVYNRPFDEAIRQRAEELEQDGLKAIDALHIACAEAVESDYFITCDKRLINRCSRLKMRVVNPADFVLEISNDDPG